MTGLCPLLKENAAGRGGHTGGGSDIGITVCRTYEERRRIYKNSAPFAVQISHGLLLHNI